MEVIRIRGIKGIVIPQSAQPVGATGPLRFKADTKRKRRKQSKSLKLFEKLARRGARAERRMFDEYLYRHDRSNRKKKNGWFKDLGKNLTTSSKKGRKRFKLSTLF
jgi:hypothetical protein